ncbi:MAG TPA: DUF3021 family protein [Candidatus Erysipelatoclostridium merdavium]|uniref:DUF3021 family protein n=1 Tax=Candidatus Erysipelatoclostridium merdavium TaxID=2838566 RepID=A0A9D1XRW8_9FIRM|nr:DUF3021 family protein [Candidatus Erysipelatoclostridium merdavium]
MKLKKMIRLYLTTTCISYTFVMIGQAILCNLSDTTMSNNLILIIFAICALVNVLIHIIHYQDLKDWLTSVLSILSIFVIVSLANYLLGYNNAIFEFEHLIFILIMSIAVYFFVITVVFIKNQDDAKKINEKLKATIK